MDDPRKVLAIAFANELRQRPLGERNVLDLIAFLRALTDPASLDLRDDVPDAVPSGLPIED